MVTEQLSVEELDRRVQALVESESPTAVFRSLLEGARLAAPRASVYLVRQGAIKGWGAVGYPADAARLHRGQVAPLGEGWLGRVASHDVPLHETQAQGRCPDFGQPPATECLGTAVRVKQQPIALLVIERSGTDEIWRPAILNLLVRVAQLRLDLDLIRRKLGSSPGATTTPTRERVAAAPAKTVAEAEEDSGEEHVELAPVVAGSAEIDLPSRQLDAAQRYARLVATDIRLYNEDAVVQGRREGDLSERLGEQLTRGRETFLRRHGSLGPAALQILREAYLQVLAGGDDELLPTTLFE